MQVNEMNDGGGPRSVGRSVIRRSKLPPEEIQAAQKKLIPAVHGRETRGWCRIYVIVDSRQFITSCCCSLVHLALRADAVMEMAAVQPQFRDNGFLSLLAAAADSSMVSLSHHKTTTAAAGGGVN